MSGGGPCPSGPTPSGPRPVGPGPRGPGPEGAAPSPCASAGAAIASVITNTIEYLVFICDPCPCGAGAELKLRAPPNSRFLSRPHSRRNHANLEQEAVRFDAATDVA